MANPYRATAEFTAEGQTYRLRFDWNAACEFEQATGKTVSEVLSDVAAGRVSAVALRGLMWAGLHGDDRGVTLVRAGELIGLVGRVEAVRICGVALRYFFPELEAAPPDPPNPAPSQ